MLAGHVTGHPQLGDDWIHTSPLMGLDPRGRWARSRSRWYRLDAPLAEAHRGDVGLAGLPVQVIETNDARVAGHFAALREGVARLLKPLAEHGGEGRP